MSGAFSGKGARAALDFLTGTASGFTAPPRTMYLMLLTSAPPSNDPSIAQLTEVNDVGYARQPVVFSAAATADPAQPSSTSNSAPVLFGPFTSSVGLAAPTTHGVLVTSSSGTAGSIAMSWQWDNAGTATQNQSLQVAIGALVMTV